MDRWEGKVCVVTGASAGIGSAVCVALADSGVRVVGLARRPQLVQQLQSKVKGAGSIISRQCDVSKSGDVAAAFKWIEEEVGSIHILVNNAGVLCNGQITEVGDKTLNEEELLATIDINVKGPIMCTKRAIESMTKQGVNGHIITVNSIAGHYIPQSKTFNVYPASKHAITAFHQSLNNELAQFNSRIKTTSVSPGLVATDMAGLLKSGEEPILQPEDIADAVLYALSTPPHVNINELTVTPVGEIRL